MLGMVQVFLSYKYVYKKINLPIKQIDEKENFRRIIDFKKILVGYMFHNLKN